MSHQLTPLLPIFLLIATLCSAQKTYVEGGKLNGVLPVNEAGSVVYVTVENVPEATQQELFQRARSWFTQTYKSSNSVLQINDPATGELSGNGVLSIQPSMLGVPVTSQVDHTITVEVKDGKYRATINNFYLHAKTIEGPIEAVRGTTKGFMQKVFEQTNNQTESLLRSLRLAMNTKKADF